MNARLASTVLGAALLCALFASGIACDNATNNGNGGRGGSNTGDGNDGASSTLPADATDDQVRAVFNAATGKNAGPNDILIYRPADLNEVYIVTDMPMPDAGDPVRHGAFIAGEWHATADIQSALFASLGYASADAETREDIVRRWALGIVGTPDAPEIETLDDGTVHARVHDVGNFNVAGEPMTDEWVDYHFDTTGKRVD